MSKAKIAIADMVRLYQDEGRSIIEIARLAGLTDGGVRHILKREGVTIRTKYHPEISTDGLVALYEQGISPEKMQVGLKENSIRYRLRKAGALRSKGWGNRKIPTLTLTHLYVDEGMSLKDIAKRTGMSKPAIRSRLHRAKVQLRAPMHVGWVDPKRKPTEVATTHDYAWAAGVYEGEGSVIWSQSLYRLRPVVSVVQKERWLCDRLRALFGGSIHRYVKRDGRAFYYWRLGGILGTCFLLGIFKYLSSHRQARICALYPVAA